MRGLARCARFAWAHAQRTTAPGNRHLTVPLAALAVVSAFGTLGAPFLVHSPLVLAALSPRLPFLVLAGQSTSLPVFLVVGTVRSCLADPLHYELGRRLGASAIANNPVTRTLQRVPKIGVLAAVLVRPVGRHLFAAGATGVRPRLVALADVIGTVAFLYLLSLGSSLV